MRNLPDVRDINVLLEPSMENRPRRLTEIDRHTVKINAKNIHEVEVMMSYTKDSNGRSYYFIGALLENIKALRFPFPGLQQSGRKAH